LQSIIFVEILDQPEVFCLICDVTRSPVLTAL